MIIARQDKSLEDLVATSYPYVYAEEDIDDCIEELKAYSEDSIPVLDNDNRLLGVITSSNIIDLVDDEMGEDYAMLAGLTAEEDLKEPLKESMKKRMPWLIVLLGLGMVVSSVVGVFENVVTQLPIIMAFQSLILDMAGNVGTQSLAVTIRVLMDESLTGKQKLELVFKEMRIGLCNGALLGILYLLLQGKNIGICICSFRLHRSSPSSGYADLKCSGNLYSAVLQESGRGPCSCFWSIDHHRQRPCGRCDILRTWLGVPDRSAAFGRLRENNKRGAGRKALREKKRKWNCFFSRRAFGFGK